MNRLSDFKPLGRVVLPSLGELKCSGLVVIVGPNSSGKSQLLKDLYSRLIGEPRKLVVTTEVQINKPPFDPLIKCLQDEGYFSLTPDPNNTQQIRPHTMFLGTGQQPNQIQLTQAQQWYKSFSPDSPPSPGRPIEFLNYFGRLLVTALFLERRLTSLTETQVINFSAQPPQHDLHALYLDDSARTLLAEETSKSFGRSVWPDTIHQGNMISLKVSDEGILPPADDRLSHKKMASFRSIETEGDGMKSYVATCVALLLGQRPVCLIDEPEMCLHPPQAYYLGKFIGQYGASPDRATFVATHSSHLLRGIIQSGSSIQIIRLTRQDRLFSAHLVPAAELSTALSRPTLRAEAILDGIFAQAVIVLEGDSDRVVYQAAWETLFDDFKTDIHFSTVGGTAGIADTCRLYRTLRIPIAVIADLDMLVDQDRMTKLLGALVDESTTREALLSEITKMAEEIRSLPPEMPANEVGKQLAALSTSAMDWSKGDDVALKQKLGKLENAIDRMRRLQKGGVKAFPNKLATRLNDLLLNLQKVGLFLVPVGELEEWLADYGIAVSKEKKGAWANAAAQRILDLRKQSGDIWNFVSTVGRYLTSRSTSDTLQSNKAEARSSPPTT